MDLSRLHPQARSALRAQHRVPLTAETWPACGRAWPTRRRLRSVPARDAHVTDVDAGGVPARLYSDGPDGAPVLLYAHGGGWVMGDLDTHDGLCRQLAAETGWAVLAVDYRLAPESPYPAALDDMRTGAGLAAPADRAVAWSVAGDSAGGYLAAVLARRAATPGARSPRRC